MSLHKTAIFLASRFGEFAELRAQLKTLIATPRNLQLTPIDLNDGTVSHRPPLAECLGYVRRSEIMILLLGDTYGSLAPKSEKSFTHLEYEEAMAEGVGTNVLVFCHGEHYRDGRITYADDPRLRAWQQQVEQNQILGFFEPNTSVEVMAKTIFDGLLAALYDMRFGVLSVDDRSDLPDELFDVLGDEALTDESEVRSLEERGGRDLSLLEDHAQFTSVLAAVMQPAAVAALEQRQEAQRALDIGEFGVAIGHLRRALDLKPLELISNYWLAQLYVALGRKQKAPEALEMAQRAALIAERDGLTYRAAGAYVLAARAARISGRSDEALALAQRAVEVAPRFARAHIEVARQHVLRKDVTSAMEAIKRAYQWFPRSLRDVFTDPIFQPVRRDATALMQEQKERLARDVADMGHAEQELAALTGETSPALTLQGRTSRQLIDLGRQSVRRQYERVCVLIRNANAQAREFEAHVDPVTPQREEMVFKYPGNLQVEQWLKAPGDVINPREAVFTYRFGGRGELRSRLFYGREPVRMVKRTGDDGTWVFDSAPYLFDYLPSSVVVPEPGPAQRLREAIAASQEAVIGATERVVEATDQIAGVQRQAEDLKLSQITLPAIGLLLSGAAAVFIGVVLLYAGKTFFGGLFVVAAVALIVKSLEAHSKYREHLDQMDGMLRDATSKQESAQGGLAAHEGELKSLQEQLELMETEVSRAKALAGEALERFERQALRRARLTPFANVFSAEKGDVVRVSDAHLQDGGSDRQIELQPDRSPWLPQTGRQGYRVRLARVVEALPGRIMLSEKRAYDDEMAAT